jgi:tetrahydromethanopterin S-methyltransferase subunit G
VLKQQNAVLSTRNNDLQSQVDSTDVGNNINTLFTLIFGLIIGFIISIVFARSAQKKRDSFNTISRSY